MPPPSMLAGSLLSTEERAAQNREAFQLHFGRPPGIVVDITAAEDPAKTHPTGKLKAAKYQPHKSFHHYPLFGLSSEALCGVDAAQLLVFADLSGSATLIDTRKTSSLDGRDLALLKKRIRDPGVIKFAQPATTHVAAFALHFGFECPGWFNLEWLGLKGGLLLADLVMHIFGEDFECFAEDALIEAQAAELGPEGRYAAAQRAQLAVDMAAFQLLLVKRTVDPVMWGWTLTTPRPERVQDAANGRVKLSSNVCMVERPDSLFFPGCEESAWQSSAWYGQAGTVAQTMKRFEEKCAATKKVLLHSDGFGSGQLVRALFAYAQEMLALECAAAVESGFFPQRTKEAFDTESRRDGSRLVRYTLSLDGGAWGGEILQPTKAEASCIVDARERREGLDRAKEQAKREAILHWCRKFTERMEPVLRDLRVVSTSSMRAKLRPPSKREQERLDKGRRYNRELTGLWERERAFWFELRAVEGLSELKSRKRTALTSADNRILAALYTEVDLLPNEVAERSWRLTDAPTTVRVKAKSAYTAEKLLSAVAALAAQGKTKMSAVYLGAPPPQFEEEHRRELVGSDSESDEDNGDKEKAPAAQPEEPEEDEAPVSWAVERDFWLEIYDVPGIGAPGNFDLTQNDTDALTAALKPLLPPDSNPEMDLTALVRLRHDSNAILAARCRSQELVKATLDRAKDKEINLTGLKVRLATRQPRQVRLAIRAAEARKYATLMRYPEAVVVTVDDVLERLVCRVTGEPEPPMPPEPEAAEKDDDEILEVVTTEKPVEIIDLDLDDDDDDGPAAEPSPTGQALDDLAKLAGDMTNSNGTEAKKARVEEPVVELE